MLPIDKIQEQIKSLREQQAIATSIEEINRLGKLIFDLEEGLYKNDRPI